jgi:hypothetical protein
MRDTVDNRLSDIELAAFASPAPVAGSTTTRPSA